MLSSCNMIGFLLTKDYDKARAFFETKLGFAFVSVDQFALVMQAGAHMIRISKVPSFTPVRSTVLGWEVENIEAMVSWLKQRSAASLLKNILSSRSRRSASGPHLRATRSRGSQIRMAMS